MSCLDARPPSRVDAALSCTSCRLRSGSSTDSGLSLASQARLGLPFAMSTLDHRECPYRQDESRIQYLMSLYHQLPPLAPVQPRQPPRPGTAPDDDCNGSRPMYRREGQAKERGRTTHMDSLGSFLGPASDEQKAEPLAGPGDSGGPRLCAPQSAKGRRGSRVKGRAQRAVPRERL